MKKIDKSTVEFRRLCRVLAMCSFFLFCAPIVLSANQAPPETAVEQERPSKEEMLTRLNNIFQYRKDIRAQFPDIEPVKEESELVRFKFQGVFLEDLGEDTLFNILREVNQALSLRNLQNIERTQRQMRQLRQVENVNRTQRMLRNLRQQSQAGRR